MPGTYGSYRLALTLCSLLLLGGCGGSSGAPPGPPSSSNTCDPNAAPQLVSIAVQNTAAEDLGGFPFALTLDTTDFDFSSAASDGSGLSLWDPHSKQPIPFWIESYDATAGKALIWTKLAALASQSSTTLWVTAGSIPHCDAQTGNGYSVFPFFSDVQDVGNWTQNEITLSDTVPAGPLTIQSRQVIQNDGTYNSTPSVVQASNGDWVLSYRKGNTSSQANSVLVIVRRSSDQGATWSPEQVYWNTSGNDPSLARTPGGDLLIALVKKDPNGVSGAAYSRSTDNGLTWAPFTFFDQPVSNTYAMPTQFVNDGATMYAAGYGPGSGGSTDSPSLWVSSNDGFTWMKRSEIGDSTDPDMDETSIVETAPGTFLAISRSGDGLNTYGHVSSDAGSTWQPVTSYTSQVGVLQLPQLFQAGNALLLFGREAFYSSTQLVAYASYDGGTTFSHGTVLDQYTKYVVNGGYSWPIPLPDGRIFLVFYSDPLGTGFPEIDSMFLQVGNAQEVPANAIHVTSQYQLGQASRALNLASTHYAMDFRFSTHNTPGGNQFIVKLEDDSVQPVLPLVSWRLPSEFLGNAGFIANQQLVQLFSSFSFDTWYRGRTIVDENAGQQQNEILDQFGNILTMGTPEPFVYGTSGHATQVYIGNNTMDRNVDALLKFLFVRPLPSADPQITVSRLH